ncbi:MAG: cell division FtsA domain-containing protein, partial [Bacteroidota bacterium]
HTAVIPFGGEVITKDIKEGCTVMKHQAEKLKVKFGSALADEVFDNRVIAIPGLKGREPKEISEKNLALIIQARVEEILDYVVWQIRRSGFEKKLIGGIVLTGGGALLKDIDKLTEFHTGMTARVGIPAEHLAHGNSERVYSPIYSTGIGLLLQGIKAVETGKVSYTHKEPEVVEEPTPEEVFEPQNIAATTVEEDGKWYSQLFRKTKEWFEAEPDTEY